MSWLAARRAAACVLALTLMGVSSSWGQASRPAENVQAGGEADRREGPPIHCAHIRFSGEVLDGPPDFSLFGDSYTQMTLRDWLHRLAEARQDRTIRAVALEVQRPQMNWAQAQELADAVRRLNAVKPVYAYLTSGGAMEYIVASAAREVAMEPTGTLQITGLGAELLFFRGTLDWLGIEPQLIQIGRFKGAAEPLTHTGPSKELLEMYNGLLDDLYDQLCGQIASHRKLEVPAVQKAIDAGPLSAEEARQFRLVDRCVPKADWRQHVEKTIETETRPVAWRQDYARKSAQALNLSNPFSVLKAMFGEPQEQEVVDPTIAIVHADGVIVSGQSGSGLLGQRMAGAKTLTACFDSIAEDDRIKAVIFRINSPGGSALASELICQAVERCARKKPVVASVSGVAASGGYYVAVGAPIIVADPSAITGSIGVVSGKFAISGLLEKLRIGRHELTRGRNAGLGMSRPWTDEEQAVIRKGAQRTYDVFLRRVADSRGERIKDIEGVAEGRVFTGRQAVASGLVDKLGGMREAVLVAQKLANLQESHFITLPRPRTLMELLSTEADDAAAASEGLLLLSRRPGLAAEAGLPAAPVLAKLAQSPGLLYLLNLVQLFQDETTLAAMPHYLSVRP